MNFIFKNLVIFICLLTLINVSYADTAHIVEKGEPAPISGVLITNEKAKDLYKKEQENIVLRDLRALDQKLIEHHKSASEGYKRDLERQKMKTFWSSAAWFVGGVLVTGFAARIATR